MIGQCRCVIVIPHRHQQQRIKRVASIFFLVDRPRPQERRAKAAMDAKDYLQYNLTIRLGSLLALPSKFLHRLRRIDDLLSHDLDIQSAALDLPMPITSSVHSSMSDVPRPPPSRASLAYELANMPGPFAFLTSGYALGLVTLVRR